MATTLPELLDAVERVDNRVGVLLALATRLAERFDELEELIVETHAWVHELHAAFARPPKRPPST